MLLTTAQLAQVTAGGDDYIRTKNNKVRGLALRLDENPYAPKVPGEPGVIAFGNGPRRKGRAQLFLQSGLAIPVYVKRVTNGWEYFGEYRATKILRDEGSIREYCGNRPVATQAGVLFIEAVQEPKVQVSGGGFVDPEIREEVEVAAVAYVTHELNRRGFEVFDCQAENRGYDLLAVSTSSRLLVEVKGTDHQGPRFFLTRNEHRSSIEQDDWRLFVVCEARSAPFLHEFTAEQMRFQFTLDPLAWECIQKDSIPPVSVDSAIGAA